VIRTILVTAGFLIGWTFAFQSALYAACLYLWIAYFRPEAWAWSGVFASLPLSFVAGVFLLVRSFFSTVRFRLDFRNGLLFLFLAHSLMSTAIAPHVDYSFGYLQEFAKTIVVSYLLSVLIVTEADFRLIITVIALSLGFEAGKQGWAQLVLNPGAQNNNGVPFLGDNNLVAVGMSMLLPMVGALGATSTGWRRRAFQFLSIGVIYRAISTYSRGGLLAIGAVGGMFFLRSPHKIRTIVAFAIAVALIVPVLPQAYWNRMSTITASSEERDDSQAGRLHFWRVAVSMANDRPLVGVGHRGFEPSYNRYDFLEGVHGTRRAVHSSWFGILAEVGYPGLLLFIVIFGSSVWACRKVRRMARGNQVTESLGRYAIGMEAALVAFAVGGAFVSYHYNEMLWHFFGLSMALEQVALRQAAERRQARVQAPPPPRLPASKPEPEPEFAWG
jgi:probable O-glycosylation ligase (exosortase A-associated)